MQGYTFVFIYYVCPPRTHKRQSPPQTCTYISLFFLCTRAAEPRNIVGDPERVSTRARPVDHAQRRREVCSLPCRVLQDFPLWECGLRVSLWDQLWYFGFGASIVVLRSHSSSIVGLRLLRVVDPVPFTPIPSVFLDWLVSFSKSFVM